MVTEIAMKRCIGLGLAILAGLFVELPLATAMKCCTHYTTVREDTEGAEAVLHVRLICSHQNTSDEGGKTQFQILSVLKAHPILKGQTGIKMSRYVPVEKPGDKPEFIIYVGVDKNKVDIYRGIVATQTQVDYLKGILALGTQDRSKSLKYFFPYLNHANSEIARDAYTEVSRADYRDLSVAVGDFPADKVAGWINDKNTQGYYLGLYGLLLGHCGTEKHADLLCKLLDDPKKLPDSSFEGILTGYVLLMPKEGWALVNTILKDRSRDFLHRFVALKLARFFYDSRPDVISRKQVVASVMQLLDQDDIADLAINALRQWERWDATGRVLGLTGMKLYELPLNRRAVLRFMISARDKNPAAAAFVEQMRQADAGYVQENEDLLKLEKAQSAPKTKPSS